MGDGVLPGRWTVDELYYITRYVVHMYRGRIIIDLEEAEDVVAVALIEKVYETPEVDRADLYKIAYRALAAAVGSEKSHAGLDGGEGKGPRWAAYWKGQSALVSPFEETVVEKIAARQLWAALPPRHQETLQTLMEVGSHAEAAKALNIPRGTWGTRLKFARDHARVLWFQPEAPSRQWGRDFAGREPDARGRNRGIHAIKRRQERAQQAA